MACHLFDFLASPALPAGKSAQNREAARGKPGGARGAGCGKSANPQAAGREGGRAAKHGPRERFQQLGGFIGHICIGPRRCRVVVVLGRVHFRCIWRARVPVGPNLRF